VGFNIKFSTTQSGSNQGVYSTKNEIIVQSGGKLVLNSGAKLTSAAASPSAGDWGCVYIKNGGDLDMNGNNTIEYATTGIYIREADVSIADSKSYIKHCTNQGLYLLDESSSIQNIEISDCGDQGILIYGTGIDPTINHVTVKGPSTYGIKLSSYTDMWLRNSVIDDSDISSHKCYIQFSAGIDMDGEHNNFDTKTGTYVLYMTSADNMDITSNYWGSSTPDSTKICDDWESITAWRPFDTSSNAGAGAGKIAVLATNGLREGRRLEASGDYNGALKIYYKVISGTSDQSTKRKAVTNIYRVNQRNDLAYTDLRRTIETELPKATGSYRAILDYLLCDILVQEERYDEAADAFIQMADIYGNSVMGVEMLIKASGICSEYLKDNFRAKGYADRAAAINPGHHALMEAYVAVGIDYDPSQHRDVFDEAYFKQLPEDYYAPGDEPASDEVTEFVTTIPNPFNPATTITYAIKEPSQVKLTFYAITGQKVATLVDEQMSAGTHSVTFDGSHLASGIYLYSFRSKGFTRTGRMLLVK